MHHAISVLTSPYNNTIESVSRLKYWFNVVIYRAAAMDWVVPKFTAESGIKKQRCEKEEKLIERWTNRVKIKML